MFTLAHFSDPHIGPLPRQPVRALLSKRITGYINYKRNRLRALTGPVLENLINDLKRQNPDHIALTGDLVNIALPSEITAARNWLETIGSPDKVSLIPGNHDAYVAGALDQAKAAWAPYLLGDGADPSALVHFPYLRRRGPLALIGLSSAVATLPFMATGRVGTVQLEETADLLARLALENCFRVVMIHHPPFVEKDRRLKRLVDYRKFNKVIAEVGAELILHGHTHRASVKYAEGPAGPIPLVGVPSASSGMSGHHEPARYNLYEIARPDQHWRCSMIERGLTEDGTFAEIGRSDLI